jgi:hypothetical protein
MGVSPNSSRRWYWEPWEGSQTLPRCCAAGTAGRLRTRLLAADLVRFLAPRLHGYGHAPSSLVATEVPRYALLGPEFGDTPYRPMVSAVTTPK